MCGVLRVRHLVFLVLLLFSGASFAAPVCTVTPFYDGYSATFNTYDLYQGYIYGLDERFLWMTLVSGSVAGFANVPQSVPQSVTNTTNGDTFYNTRIKGHYAQVLQSEDCGILLAEDGKYLLAQ